MLDTMRAASVLALAAAAAPAAAQDEPIEVASDIDEDRALIEVLKEGMRQQPGNAEWSFTAMEPNDVFFPGDSEAFAGNEQRDYGGHSVFEKITEYPRDVERVEQWYLSQIPDLYEEAWLNPYGPVQVLYLPGCDERGIGLVDSVLPGEAALDSEFDALHWNTARVEMAIEQAGFDPSEVEVRLDEPSPAEMRALNRRLLLLERSDEGDGRAEFVPPIVLRRYCGPPSMPARFPGLPPPPPPPPPPSPAPAATEPRYFFLDLPDGMAAARLGRGVEARRCRQRRLPLQACLATAADEMTAVPFVAEGRHVFVGRLNGQWISGSFVVDIGRTHPIPPPLMQGQTYAQSGYAIRLVHVAPDP